MTAEIEYNWIGLQVLTEQEAGTVFDRALRSSEEDACLVPPSEEELALPHARTQDDEGSSHGTDLAGITYEQFRESLRQVGQVCGRRLAAMARSGPHAPQRVSDAAIFKRLRCTDWLVAGLKARNAAAVRIRGDGGVGGSRTAGIGMSEGSRATAPPPPQSESLSLPPLRVRTARCLGLGADKGRGLQARGSSGAQTQRDGSRAESEAAARRLAAHAAARDAVKEFGLSRLASKRSMGDRATAEMLRLQRVGTSQQSAAADLKGSQGTLKQGVRGKFGVAFGALSASILELHQALDDCMEGSQLAEIDCQQRVREAARAAAALEHRPCMLIPLSKHVKYKKGLDSAREEGREGGDNRQTSTRGAESGGGVSNEEQVCVVNSLNTALSKGSPARIREYAESVFEAASGAARKDARGSKSPKAAQQHVGAGGDGPVLAFAQLLQAQLPSSMRLQRLESECISVRVHLAPPQSLEGWRDDPLSERLFLVLALGEDVRVRKLVDIKEAENVEFVFDGILCEHALYVAVHREPTQYQIMREKVLMSKAMHPDTNWDVLQAGERKKGLLAAARDAMKASKGLPSGVAAISASVVATLTAWERFCLLRPVKAEMASFVRDQMQKKHGAAWRTSTELKLDRDFGSVGRAGENTLLGEMRVKLHTLLRGMQHKKAFLLRDCQSDEELLHTQAVLTKHYMDEDASFLDRTADRQQYAQGVTHGVQDTHDALLPLRGTGFAWRRSWISHSGSNGGAQGSAVEAGAPEAGRVNGVGGGGGGVGTQWSEDLYVRQHSETALTLTQLLFR